MKTISFNIKHLLLFVGFALLLPFANVSAGVDSCPFVATADTTVVVFPRSGGIENFNSPNRLWSYDAKGTEAVYQDVSKTIAAGEYQVLAHVYDAYKNRAARMTKTGRKGPQKNETIRIELLAGNRVVAKTGGTPDLKDNANYVSWAGQVSSKLKVPNGVNKVRAQHNAFEDKSSANSVNAGCAAFTRINECYTKKYIAEVTEWSSCTGGVQTAKKVRYEKPTECKKVDDVATTRSCVTQCSDSKDNDGDGKTDYPNDPGCDSYDDNDEYNDWPECSDGKDNDGDGNTDYPNDTGCEDKDDDDETDEVKPQCSDGKDNDGDGNTDYPNDPGCDDKDDDDETDETKPECSDGKDNDGDGNTDYPNDLECDDKDDDDEDDDKDKDKPECSDKKDNDGDGDVDYPNDPECDDKDDDDESGNTECSDSKDNDGDGKVDYPNDPGCDDKDDDDEKDKVDPPTVSLEASRDGGTGTWSSRSGSNITDLKGNEQIRLYWNSTNASSCSGQNVSLGGETGGVANNVTEPGFGVTKNYVVTCTGIDGGSATDSISVEKPAVGPSITADDSSVHIGEDVEIDWRTNTSDTASCTLVETGNSGLNSSYESGLPTGSGQENLTINETTTYTIACPAGSDSVTVYALPKVYES